jgi:hypothetical protein
MMYGCKGGELAMWPFNRKPKPNVPALMFKSGEAFVDYHCKYMVTRLEPGSPLAALVLDATEVFGTSVAVKTAENGLQTATLRVASDDGGFMVVAQTASGGGEPLKPGDVVAWVPAQHLPQMARACGDERSGWVGLIVAKIAPEIDISAGQMTVLCRY